MSRGILDARHASAGEPLENCAAALNVVETLRPPRAVNTLTAGRSGVSPRRWVASPRARQKTRVAPASPPPHFAESDERNSITQSDNAVSPAAAATAAAAAAASHNAAW